MSRYWTVASGLVALFLTSFLAVAALDVSILTHPTLGNRTVGGLLGVVLLTADAVLPVASSIVMIALGALYGPVVGFVLALVGLLGTAAFGFALGRCGEPVLRRFVAKRERDRADRLLERWGLVAIAASRPVPLLAETVTMLAGASRLGWGRFLLAAGVGSLPEAVAYPVAGATADSFESAAWIWTSLLVVVGILWLVGRSVDRRRAASLP